MGVGVENMAAMPIAERVNFASFQQAPTGATVCVGGRFKEQSATGSSILTTTDGGSLTVLLDAGLADGLGSSAFSGFLEVFGKKDGDATLRATTVMSHGDQIDVEMWNEMVKMIHMPQLRSLFEPKAMPAV